MRRVFLGLALLLVMLWAVSAIAGTATEAVEKDVNKVLAVLRDPALQGEAHKEVKATRIEAVADHMFNWTALSKRALSRNWKKFSAEQQKEFVELFRQVLYDAWIDKILAYKDERVVFEKESQLSETKVEVQSKIITKSAEIPITYRLFVNKGQWQVYDMVIEGVSLVQNYRTQFRSILAKQSPEDLLKTLREKVGKS